MSTMQSLFKKGIIMTLILILLICFSMPVRTHAQSRAVVAHCNEYITLWKTNSTNADAITRIPLGEEVTVLSYTSNGFAKVQYMSIACAWLTEQARRYKSDPGSFAWDWRDEKGLYYEHTFSEE